ncbi:cardiolipin synthase B [Betaproteobacteria bacterium]|nr:cardiolipin synthase B [Betaproteobacteria bacterium]GHU42863.1 cardiolipin synthase B [Betaproteobacteria bacterium]
MPEFTNGNRITLLESGAEYFPALLAAIDQARGEIFLESYIFADDEVGNAVIAALVRAAERAVAVRVLVDGFGARDFPKIFGARLESAGAHHLTYRKEIGRFSLQRFHLRRLHRKLAVIDGQIAFVGGINIIDDNNAPAALSPRYDYAVKVEGQLVTSIRHAARRMWENVAWVSFKRRYRLPHVDVIAAASEHSGQQRAAFLLRDNIRHRNDIAKAYLAAIHNAKKSVLIANAYFLPGARFRHALKAAAARGVQVTLLLQGQSDHPLLQYATQALYDTLLSEGIRIFEYKKSCLHAKVAVVDEQWATVGSSNIDPFSLLLSKEGNVVVDDKPFAVQLAASLKAAIERGAQERTRQDIRRQSPLSRLLRWSSYGLLRLCLGLVGNGAKQWDED